MTLNPYDNPSEGMFPIKESILLNDRLREIESELCFSAENSLLSYELLSERRKIRDTLGL